MLLSDILFFSALTLPLVSADCTHNNCERAFNGAQHTAEAKAFCSAFTTATTLATNAIPSYARPACIAVAQISSVCSCQYPATTTISSSSSSSSVSSSTSSASTSSSTSTSSSASTFSTSTITSHPEFGPGCAADNCLRAFDRENGQAFCSAFTALGYAFTGFPSYATQCTGSTSSRVSSACTCLNYYGNTVTTSPTTTSSSSSGSSTSSSSLSLSSSSSSSSTSTSRSSTSSSSSSSTTDTSVTNPTNHCAPGNNCLRAMIREGGATAGAFCATYTMTAVTATTALPTYVTQCTQNPTSQLSSACSCLFTSGGQSNGLFIPFPTPK